MKQFKLNTLYPYVIWVLRQLNRKDTKHAFLNVNIQKSRVVSYTHMKVIEVSYY
jgi:hypothetical protein